MFSIILPSYLGYYKRACKDRERKLIRAIESVLNQKEPFELIVIADGCEDTIKIVSKYTDEHRQGLIRLIELDKQRPFSGVPRNTGIGFAKGEMICYLDSDDIFGTDHLQVLKSQFNGQDWIFFNDLTWNGQEFEERTCQIKPYQCGTSNIAHKKSMSSRWNPVNEYGKDDWNFIQNLKQESDNWTKTECGSYCVCHIPGKYEI